MNPLVFMVSLFQGGKISGILTHGAGFQNPPHDLAASGLGKGVSKNNLFGTGNRSHFVTHMFLQFLTSCLLPVLPASATRRHEWHFLLIHGNSDDSGF